jgi:hypothetical protein
MQQQEFDLAAGGDAFAENAGGDDARLVEDEQVAFVKIVGKVGKAAVGGRIAVKYQQAACIALRGRCLSDQLGG